MSEYIEREAAQGLLQKRSEELLQAGNPIPGGAVSGASLLLSLIPAADVAPIVHGEWREDTDPADGDLRCTHCRTAWPKCVQKQIAEQGIWTLQTLFKYCPNCGAKMDKEAENERND